MAAGLDAGTDQADAQRPPGDGRRPVRDGHAAHRGGALGGDGAGIHDGARHTGQGVAEDDRAVDGREARDGRLGRAPCRAPAPRAVAAFPGKPTTHLMPSRSSWPSASRAAQQGRHGVPERRRSAWMDADLGRQLRVGDERLHASVAPDAAAPRWVAWPPITSAADR